MRLGDDWVGVTLREWVPSYVLGRMRASGHFVN